MPICRVACGKRTSWIWCVCGALHLLAKPKAHKRGQGCREYNFPNFHNLIFFHFFWPFLIYPCAPPAREILSEEPRTRGTKLVPSRLISGRLLIFVTSLFAKNSDTLSRKKTRRFDREPTNKRFGAELPCHKREVPHPASVHN